MKNKLISAQSHQISNQKAKYIAMTAKLDAMSPLKVLSRGYAMAQTDEGCVLKSVHQINSGDHITITVSDGALYADVTEVKENGR